MSHRSRAAVRVAAVVIPMVLGTRSVVLAQQPLAPQAPRPAAAHGAAPTDKPMNVQVLKDLSASDLHDAMVFIAASLGTNCGFCHVRTPQGEWAFDRDDKPEKKTARQMIRMMRGVNEQYFEGRQTVTCSSCHQARREPNPLPPLAEPPSPGQSEAMPPAGRGEGRGGPPPAGRSEGRGGPPPAPTETADQVVGKYLQALGGKERVRSIASMVMRGTVTNRAGQASPLQVEQALPNRYRSTVDSTSPASRGYDGSAAWQQMGANVRPLEGVQRLYVAQLGDLGLARRLEEATALAVARGERLDGRDVIWLSVGRGPGAVEMLAFDGASGLLARRMVGLPTPLGRLPLQIDYADYRDVDGVKVPFDVRVTDWQGIQAQKFSEVKLNAPIDDSRFAAPKTGEPRAGGSPSVSSATSRSRCRTSRSLAARCRGW